MVGQNEGVVRHENTRAHYQTLDELQQHHYRLFQDGASLAYIGTLCALFFHNPPALYNVPLQSVLLVMAIRACQWPHFE